MRVVSMTFEREVRTTTGTARLSATVDLETKDDPTSVVQALRGMVDAEMRQLAQPTQPSQGAPAAQSSPPQAGQQTRPTPAQRPGAPAPAPRQGR